MILRLLKIVLLAYLTPAMLMAAESSDYQLEDLDGKVYRVSDNRGKFLVINFWATWCAPCLTEMPELERFYQENKATAMVWGVTFEDSSKERILQFVENLGISFPILGHGQDPLTGFGSVTVLPTTFVIDPEGLFLHRFEGPINAFQISNLIATYKP